VKTLRRAALALLLLALSASAQQPQLPAGKGAVRFAVIGDTGTGDKHQYQIAALLKNYYDRYPFDFVLMMGDNLYGGESPDDYEKKFSRPYQPLLEKDVKFYAALGNHDDPAQRFYEKFNMGGKRYYTFKKGDVRFFALDSTYMDLEQLRWLEAELQKSNDRWKICFFHHPLYSSGKRHGPDIELRQALEPLFLKYGVNVVFAGHEHFYERIRPQKGIYYFIEGGSAKLREGNIGSRSEFTEKGEDQDNTFMVVEIEGDSLNFQTIRRDGQTVDAGVLPRLVNGQPVRATQAAVK
jgi:predicted phosphodiesterase